MENVDAFLSRLKFFAYLCNQIKERFLWHAIYFEVWVWHWSLHLRMMEKSITKL